MQSDIHRVSSRQMLGGGGGVGWGAAKVQLEGAIQKFIAKEILSVASLSHDIISSWSGCSGSRNYQGGWGTGRGENVLPCKAQKLFDM